MRIHADPDPDPGQTLKSHKIELLHEITLKALNCKKTEQLPGYYLHILVSSIIRNADPDKKQTKKSSSPRKMNKICVNRTGGHKYHRKNRLSAIKKFELSV
jgi:hypothetical protein